jgi:hypothetical protein
MGCRPCDRPARPSRFEPPTSGLCDLTHLSIESDYTFTPVGVLAIQSLRLPPVSGAWFGIALLLARRRQRVILVNYWSRRVRN